MARLEELLLFTVRHPDIEADGVGSETLALRKELGSGVLCDGECKMLEQGYGEACKDANVPETLALWKELVLGSYVTGRQDVGTGL
ncbi:hypothetical protein MUG91_G578n12, partial [Manis pentadactyla]